MSFVLRSTSVGFLLMLITVHIGSLLENVDVDLMHVRRILVSSNDFTPQRYTDFLRDVITRFSDR